MKKKLVVKPNKRRVVERLLVPQVQPTTTQPVHLKLTVTERIVLDRLVRNKWYETRSAALRAGLGMLFDKHKITKEEEQAIERERMRNPPRRGRFR